MSRHASAQTSRPFSALRNAGVLCDILCRDIPLCSGMAESGKRCAQPRKPSDSDIYTNIIQQRLISVKALALWRATVDSIGKNVFKGVVLNKVANEKGWGPTLFWGLILFSPAFRKIILICIAGIIIVFLSLSSQKPLPDATITSSPPAEASKLTPPNEPPQMLVAPTAIESPATSLTVMTEDAHSDHDPKSNLSSRSDAEPESPAPSDGM